MTDGAYFPHLAKEWKAWWEGLLAVPGPIFITGHVRPDGDSLGSSAAVWHRLQELGREAYLIEPGDRPANFAFLTAEAGDLLPVPSESAATIVALDSADQRRLPDGLKAPERRILAAIDHHVSQTFYAGSTILDGEAAATCEILAGCLLDEGAPISPASAAALYTGILTDTNGFRNAGTSERIFAIARELVRLGAEPGAIAEAVYFSDRREKMALLQSVLASLQYDAGGALVVGRVQKDELGKLGAVKADLEGIVEQLLAIEGVQVAALLQEDQGELKGSLRSLTDAVDLSEIARSLNGGGHRRAAGFNTAQSADQVHERLRTELEGALSR
jgi:phosphoesterase RecJ-like protein